MHVSVNFIFIWALQRDLEYPSINTFFSPEKLMAAARSGVGERVESTVTVSARGWLNYSLWVISSSWHCQRRRGKEVSLWQQKFGGWACFHKCAASLEAAAFPQKSNKGKCSAFYLSISLFRYMTLISCDWMFRSPRWCPLIANYFWPQTKPCSR